MKILIVGGGGFIGSHLVQACMLNCWDVYVLDNFSSGKHTSVHEKATVYCEDVRNLKQIKPLFVDIDIVFHLAALPRIPISVKDPILTNDHNVNGTLNVLTAARDAGVKKFIFSSSSSVYGNQEVFAVHEELEPKPINPYGLQKLTGEKYCQLFFSLYGLETVCLRYFNVYGPGQSDESAYSNVISIFLKQLRSHVPLTIRGDGQQTRDFTYVEDVVQANLLAMKIEGSVSPNVINIGTSVGYAIKDLANFVLEGESRTSQKIIYTAARQGDIRHMQASNKKARELLGWTPKISLREGLSILKRL